MSVRTRVRGAATVVIALMASLTARVADAQTVGKVAIHVGAGVAAQAADEFSPIGVHLWTGAETVLDRRVRVRLDMGIHHFGYSPIERPPCPRTQFCAPALTSALQVVALTGVYVWRDTTRARPWYGLAGLGAYSALNGRDGNSRIGLTAGAGWSFGLEDRLSLEARVHLPYDANGYKTFWPVTVGWKL